MRYAERILTALAIDRPTDSITAVKDVVGEELARLDRRAALRRTEYFNHSYAPDFVLQWPDGVNGTPDRHVYLRFQSRRTVLHQDLDLLADQAPIIFGLGTVDESSEGEERLLQEAARSSNSLVTDSDGIERVLDAREGSPFLKVVTTAFGKAGRGVLDEPAASEMTESLTAGFAGARARDRTTTGAAAAIITDVLTEEFAGPFVGFLRAIWVGNGGDPSLFPTTHPTSTPLPDEALQLLLDMEEIRDDDFWWQVGAKLTLEQLGRMRLEGLSLNLQNLVRAAHPVLTAKLCKVLADQPRLEDDLPTLFWVIERGLLTLRGSNFSAYLASRQEAMTVQGEERQGVNLHVLQERADKNRVPVGQFQLSREDRNMAYGSETAPDVIHDTEVGLLAQALGPTAFVEKAEARLPGGRVLQLDFTTLTASGRTAAQYPIREILLPALALLWVIRKEERKSLEDLLPLVFDESRQTRFNLDTPSVEGPS